MGRVHAVVAPTAAGREALRRVTAGAASARSSRATCPTASIRCCCPGPGAVVEALPRDAQDKVTVGRARRALRRGRAGARRCRFGSGRRGRACVCCANAARERRRASSRPSLEDRPMRLPQLEGHFEGLSRWSRASCSSAGPSTRRPPGWAERPRLAGLEALKFPQPLLPGRTASPFGSSEPASGGVLALPAPGRRRRLRQRAAAARGGAPHEAHLPDPDLRAQGRDRVRGGGPACWATGCRS